MTIGNPLKVVKYLLKEVKLPGSNKIWLESQEIKAYYFWPVYREILSIRKDWTLDKTF